MPKPLRRYRQPEYLTTTELSEIIGFTLRIEWLKSLELYPDAIDGRYHFWRAVRVPAICRRIAHHYNQLAKEYTTL